MGRQTISSSDGILQSSIITDKKLGFQLAVGVSKLSLSGFAMNVLPLHAGLLTRY
jgi:hypothetical protein